MIVLDPRVRLPLLALGVVAIVVGALLLGVGVSASMNGPLPVGLVWRGGVMLAIGVVAIMLVRRRRPS